MKMESYWTVVWQQFKKSKTGFISLLILLLFFTIGVYAPLFASSKPLLVLWDHSFYFPLLRYLFYTGFYTKPIDLFFNLLMFTLPIALGGIFLLKKGRKFFLATLLSLHVFVFIIFLTGIIKNPASDAVLLAAKKKSPLENVHFHEDPLLSPLKLQSGWAFDLKYFSPYSKLNQVLEYKKLRTQHERLKTARDAYQSAKGRDMPTLWHVWQRNELAKENELRQSIGDRAKSFSEVRDQLPKLMEAYRPFSHAFIRAKYTLSHAESSDEKAQAEKHLLEVVHQGASHRTALVNARQLISTYQKTQGQLSYFLEKKNWLETESGEIRILIPPLARAFHWEEDAGGAQEANQFVPWWELTRINRKDLAASLIFGIRVSIVVGVLAIAIALVIGIPLGTVAGYFTGKVDLILCRIIEMWEAMPTFFMLLLVVAITHSKSIFLVITVLGAFGWTSFARFIRSEVLKQRKFPYVDASKALGYTHFRIMFSHILPNAIPPILTLLPFAMMAAITSEAGLSFLGLGEEGSTSWGVLMDEGRSVFPAESYLLWPPAILLTILLIAIALIGDSLRDAIDPKMRQ